MILSGTNCPANLASDRSFSKRSSRAAQGGQVSWPAMAKIGRPVVAEISKASLTVGSFVCASTLLTLNKNIASEKRASFKGKSPQESQLVGVWRENYAGKVGRRLAKSTNLFYPPPVGFAVLQTLPFVNLTPASVERLAQKDFAGGLSISKGHFRHLGPAEHPFPSGEKTFFREFFKGVGAPFRRFTCIQITVTF